MTTIEQERNKAVYRRDIDADVPDSADFIIVDQEIYQRPPRGRIWRYVASALTPLTLLPADIADSLRSGTTAVYAPAHFIECWPDEFDLLTTDN